MGRTRSRGRTRMSWGGPRGREDQEEWEEDGPTAASHAAHRVMGANDVLTLGLMDVELRRTHHQADH